MKAPISWIKEYVPLTVRLDELVEKLTMAGTEVSSVEVIGRDWLNIYIAELTAVNPHPDAQRLRLATVSLGEENETVVCGAPNLKVGDKIAFARVGATMIDGHSGKKTKLKAAKIRGVESKGMVCSEKELGLSDNHEGILVLPEDAPIGKPLMDYMGDVFLNLEVTPNRPDLLSITGIAREIAALNAIDVKIPQGEYEEKGVDINDEIKITVKDDELCPRYCASLVKGVKLGESPQWIKRRLTACGMRPINNIVDITNYVMLEFGQPLHAFDYNLLRQKEIIVKRAQDGEKFTTLDNIERELDSNMLVIADGKGTVALAGVMGGLNSEVNNKTVDVLLEAANFSHKCIHYTARKLGLPSEASLRFEKGLNSQLALPTLKRATQLLIEHAGGKASQGITDECSPLEKRAGSINLIPAEMTELLGFAKLRNPMEELKRLGFSYTKLPDEEEDDGEKGYVVKVPYWRSDIHIAEDLLEEIARIKGYDKIPQKMLSNSLPTQPIDSMIGLKRRARNSLVGFGFQEISNYTLTSREKLAKAKTNTDETKISPMRVINPMSVEQEYLRTSMRTDLLEALVDNRKHEEGAIRIFEQGRIFLSRPKGGQPLEPEMIYGLMCNSKLGERWPTGEEPLDFYTAKGVIEGLLDEIGITAEYEEDQDDGLHPGCQAKVLAGGKKVGVLGKLHPKVAQSFEITEDVYLIGLSLSALLPHLADYENYNKVSAYPSIERDISITIDEGVSHRQIIDVIKGYPLVTKAELFDVYTGKQVTVGQKSLAYRLTIQSKEKTLTDQKANQIQAQILKKLTDELGATLRA